MPSEGYEEENEEISFENDGSENEVEELSGFGASIVQRPSFDRDDLKYAVHMGTSPYLIDIQNAIMKMRVTTDYQVSLLSCVNALFAQERLMANNTLRKTGRFGHTDPLYYVRIFAQQSLVMTRTHATQADLQAINAVEFEKRVLAVFEDYVSRSVGPKRERLINNEISSRSVQASEITKYTDEGNAPQKKKRGLFGFGGK